MFGIDGKIVILASNVVVYSLKIFKIRKTLSDTADNACQQETIQLIIGWIVKLIEILLELNKTKKSVFKFNTSPVLLCAFKTNGEYLMEIWIVQELLRC